ncbi:MAG TPA: hypothetical protein VN513_02540 [Gemmatimonadales bacterium]|nr:hypothetical protein [Gemmatimonadales bacterium]
MHSLRMVSLLTLLCASPLIAQDKEKVCTDFQNRPMRVGEWADYRWKGGRSEGSTMRMALVGTEAVAGKPNYWYEIALNDARHGKTILQLLVPGFGFQASSIHGLIMKSGSEPAMRMPQQMVQMMAGQMGQNFAAEFARKCAQMEVAGWEQLTVPAGTFRALHIKDAGEQTEAWVVPDLYFGVARVQLKDGSAMELTGKGTGAKSSITETPQVMPSPR